MVGADVVITDRHHDEGGQLIDAATDDLEQVQRGVIGPLDVLDHRDARAAVGPEEAEEGRGHLMAIARIERLAQPRRTLVGHVEDGPEGTRRRQRVTRAPQDPAFPPAGEGFDERALPDAGFAAHEHESAPVPDRLTEQGVEPTQERLALEHHHRADGTAWPSSLPRERDRRSRGRQL